MSVAHSPISRVTSRPAAVTIVAICPTWLNALSTASWIVSLRRSSRPIMGAILPQCPGWDQLGAAGYNRAAHGARAEADRGERAGGRGRRGARAARGRQPPPVDAGEPDSALRAADDPDRRTDRASRSRAPG